MTLRPHQSQVYSALIKFGPLRFGSSISCLTTPPFWVVLSKPLILLRESAKQNELYTWHRYCSFLLRWGSFCFDEFACKIIDLDGTTFFGFSVGRFSWDVQSATSTACFADETLAQGGKVAKASDLFDRVPDILLR